MLNLTQRAAQEAGVDVTSPVKSVKRKTVVAADASVYARANGIDTIKVLERLSIEHWTTDRGEFFVCPGCKNRESLIGDTGGGKCLHDSCAHVGPLAHPGFRTNADIVAESQGIPPIEAAKWLCDEFGFSQRKAKQQEQQDPQAGEPFEPKDEQGPNAPPANAAQQTPGAKPPTEWVVAFPEQIFAPLTEPDYLIAGLIRRGGLLEIQAYGGSGKSWLAVNLALCVASGLPWLGRLPTKACTVACLDYENGFYEMARRLQANAKALELATPVQGIGLITMPDMYMTSDGFEASITKLAAAYQVIVIDTLKAASPGVDENDSKMRESLDRLRRVGERTNCTFVVLIHSKKKSNSATEIDPRERGRGSSAIYDAADAQLGIEYEQGKPLQVVQTKARSGRYIDPFQVAIEDGVDGAVHVVASDAPKAASKSLDDFENVVCVAVLEALRANPGASMRLLSEKCGKRQGTISAALEQLERNGVARNAGTGNTGRWFAT